MEKYIKVAADSSISELRKIDVFAFRRVEQTSPAHCGIHQVQAT